MSEKILKETTSLLSTGMSMMAVALKIGVLFAMPTYNVLDLMIRNKLIKA